jgi:DUF1680 family protein
MRTLASLHHYLATSDEGGVQIHQYASGRIGDLRVATNYPWAGRIEVEVTEPRDAPWALSLRVPAWAAGARLSVNGEALDPPAPGYARVERTWRAGDRVVLELPLKPRLTAPHPRVDASRGCLAIERGPLVYCIEEADAPAGAIVDDLRIDPAAELRSVASSDLGGIVAVDAAGAHEPLDGRGGPATLRAIPYARWGNRGEGAMRVWIPVRESAS